MKLLFNHRALFLVQKLELLLKAGCFSDGIASLLESLLEFSKDAISLLTNATSLRCRKRKIAIVIKSNTFDTAIEVVIDTASFVQLRAI